MHTEDEKDSGENRHNRDGFGTPLPSCASSYFTLQQTHARHNSAANACAIFRGLLSRRADGRTERRERAGGRRDPAGLRVCVLLPGNA